MKKIIKRILLSLTALTSIPALAGMNLNCPAPNNVICMAGKWSVRGGGWAQASPSQPCTSADTVDNFISAFTLTTYHNAGSNGQKFTSGPFSGDYMPIGTPFCTYSINGGSSSTTVFYAITGNKSTVSFTSTPAENYWSYGSNSYGPVYNCTDSTGVNCGLTFP